MLLCEILPQEMQLTGARAENNALRNELSAAQKRTADVEERLRAAAAQGRSTANGITAGFLSNKKARGCPVAWDVCTACQCCRSCLRFLQTDVRELDALAAVTRHLAHRCTMSSMTARSGGYELQSDMSGDRTRTTVSTSKLPC